MIYTISKKMITLDEAQKRDFPKGYRNKSNAEERKEEESYYTKSTKRQKKGGALSSTLAVKDMSNALSQGGAEEPMRARDQSNENLYDSEDDEFYRNITNVKNYELPELQEIAKNVGLTNYEKMALTALQNKLRPIINRRRDKVAVERENERQRNFKVDDYEKKQAIKYLKKNVITSKIKKEAKQKAKEDDEPVEYYTSGSMAGRKKPTKKEEEVEKAEIKKALEEEALRTKNKAPVPEMFTVIQYCKDKMNKYGGDGKAFESFLTDTEEGRNLLHFIADETSQILNANKEGNTNIPDCITKYGELRETFIYDLLCASCIFEIKFRAKNGVGYKAIRFGDPDKYIQLTATKIEGNQWFTPVWKKDPEGNFKIVNVICDYIPSDGNKSNKIYCSVYKQSNFRTLYVIFLFEDGFYKYDISDDVTDKEKEYNSGRKNILIKLMTGKNNIYEFDKTRYNKLKNDSGKWEYQIPKSKFIKL